ncbi:methyl-accepting chemotaxis protein [Bacterioplanoides sp.]|uniref:methyl-accepting chemotaxis protein n=1 Tax=Bacterioplanoides sp. TaxID=2066072 RepID=UPI003B00F10A
MSMLRNIKISQKIPGAIAIFVFLPVIIAYLAFSSNSTLNQGSQEIYNNYFTSVVNLTDIRKLSYEEFVWMKSHIISPNDQAMREAEQHIQDAESAMKISIQKFSETLDQGEETRLFQQLQNNLSQLNQLRDRIILLSQQNNDTEADELANSEYRRLFMTLQQQIEGMFQTNVVGAQSYHENNESTYQSANNTLLLMVLFVIAVGLTTGWILISTIQTPLLKTKQHLTNIAENNDLSRLIPVEGHDEITDVSKAFNHTIESIRQIIIEMNQAMPVLKDQSGALLSTVDQAGNDLNHSSELLSNVQHSTSEITLAIDEIALSATNASAEATQSDKETEAGRQIQQQTVNAVEELRNKMSDAGEQISGLSTDSENIGSVLDVIRGIAEQTNLLALNAAIEAARAGEQGRGFAVVADEVRSLAQRTQESTSEIQTMIEKLQSGAHSSVSSMNDCIQSLGQTVDLTGQSQQSLTAISETIQKILSINDQVASATEEQSVTVKQIIEDIIDANQSTQRSSGSFKTLQNSSSQLLHIVSVFEPLVGKFKI